MGPIERQVSQQMNKAIAGIAIALLSFFAISGCDSDSSQSASRSDVVSVSPDDESVNAAILAARESIEQFYRHIAAHPDDTSAMLKVETDTGSQIEHLWVDNITKEAAVLRGFVAVEPIDQSKYQFGSDIEFNESRISDWAWRDQAGDLVGGFTVESLEQRDN